jgi:hypothetical protein
MCNNRPLFNNPREILTIMVAAMEKKSDTFRGWWNAHMDRRKVGRPSRWKGSEFVVVDRTVGSDDGGFEGTRRVA